MLFLDLPWPLYILPDVLVLSIFRSALPAWTDMTCLEHNNTSKYQNTNKAAQNKRVY